MQQSAHANLQPRPGALVQSPLHRCTGVLILAFALLVSGWGCDGPQSQPNTPEKPFAGITLTLSCSDPNLVRALNPMVRVWSARHGASVELLSRSMSPNDTSDLAIITSAELGAWTEPGQILPVPPGLRDPGHPYQWNGLLPAYQGGQLAGWGGQAMAVPISGEGFVLVYRVDRLTDPETMSLYFTVMGRQLGAPATWEEFVDVAGFFAAFDERPSLPQLPSEPNRLVDLFFRVASCYDRRALTESDTQQGQPRDALAFQFRTDTGAPRLTSTGFQQAGQWLAQLRGNGCLAKAGPIDPVADLREGRALMAVLSLGELANLPRDKGMVATRFGVAPLPGGQIPAKPGQATAPVNFVPHFGGGWLGVVRSRCTNSDAAFALLAELGGPARSLELVNTPGLGIGPFRDSHLDQDRLFLWLNYGFDEARTKALQDALRVGVGKSTRNLTIGLHGPDQAELKRLLAAELTRILGGDDPIAALGRVDTAWEKANPNTPPEKIREWRRRAVGLN